MGREDSGEVWPPVFTPEPSAFETVSEAQNEAKTILGTADDSGDAIELTGD